MENYEDNDRLKEALKAMRNIGLLVVYIGIVVEGVRRYEEKQIAEGVISDKNRIFGKFDGY